VAKAGGSFTSYEKDVETARAAGAPIPQSRGGRRVCRKIQECAADELRADDVALLRQATDIFLTMDGRKGRLCTHARSVLGDGWPDGLTPLPAEERAEGAASADQADGKREVVGAFGQYISIVDRVLGHILAKPFDTTEELAAHLVETLKAACGGDGPLWEEVRGKVRGFIPDGAADEQLAGRVAAEELYNMCVVLRCSAHAANGAIKAGWNADERARELTTAIQNVAKFLRSSPRFCGILGAKGAAEAIAVCENFSFAPQRFSSKDRPLSRFVLYAKPILEALALEVRQPVSPKRQRWARDILRKLDGAAWVAIGMLADLSDDCRALVAKLDCRTGDAIELHDTLDEFRTRLTKEYVQGAMWQRKDTYSHVVAQMLRTTRVLQFGREYTVVAQPGADITNRCQARVANVAVGIRTYLEAEYPKFSAPRLIGQVFMCFVVD